MPASDTRSSTMKRMISIEKKYAVAQAYLQAKIAVLKDGYFDEIEWQNERRILDLSEPELLSEAAWVILSAGISELVVRSKFVEISDAFLNWTSASEIANQSAICHRKALRVFNHERKIGGIVAFVKAVAIARFETVKARLSSEGLQYMELLPGLGPVTRIHLAKNLGIDVAKPDRHLCRIAAACGYPDPRVLCEEIAFLTDDRVSVIDSVLWRYATLYRDYEEHFRRDLVKTQTENTCPA